MSENQRKDIKKRLRQDSHERPAAASGPCPAHVRVRVRVRTRAGHGPRGVHRSGQKSTSNSKWRGKQTTYRSSTSVEKQLDHILVNRRYHSWSRDVEANDMIHMGSDHRSVMARLVIPAKTVKEAK